MLYYFSVPLGFSLKPTNLPKLTFESCFPSPLRTIRYSACEWIIDIIQINTYDGRRRNCWKSINLRRYSYPHAIDQDWNILTRHNPFHLHMARLLMALLHRLFWTHFSNSECLHARARPRTDATRTCPPTCTVNLIDHSQIGHFRRQAAARRSESESETFIFPSIIRVWLYDRPPEWLPAWLSDCLTALGRFEPDPLNPALYTHRVHYLSKRTSSECRFLYTWL